MPWRLTREAVEKIDDRVRNIVYPHGINGCSKDGSSFLRKSGRTWRTADKLTALLTILPVVLRDYVPKVRAGVRKVILGLRILEGRCVNSDEAARLGVQGGCRPLIDGDIDKAERLIIEGLSMIEGGS